jgi:hypothetical protein
MDTATSNRVMSPKNVDTGAETRITKIVSFSSVPRITKISEIIKKQLKNTLKIAGQYFKKSLDFERLSSVYVPFMMDAIVMKKKARFVV